MCFKLHTAARLFFKLKIYNLYENKKEYRLIYEIFILSTFKTTKNQTNVIHATLILFYKKAEKEISLL